MEDKELQSDADRERLLVTTSRRIALIELAAIVLLAASAGISVSRWQVIVHAIDKLFKKAGVQYDSASDQITRRQWKALRATSAQTKHGPSLGGLF